MTSPPEEDSIVKFSLGDNSVSRRGDVSGSSSFGHVGLIDLGNMPGKNESCNCPIM